MNNLARPRKAWREVVTSAVAAVVVGFILILSGRHLTTPVDRILPVLLLLLVALSAIDRAQRSTGLLFVLPAVLVAEAIALVDERMRLAAMGLTFAGGLVLAVLRLRRGAFVAASHGMVLLLVAAIPLRFLPFNLETVASGSVVTLGGLLLLLTLSGWRPLSSTSWPALRVSLLELAVVIATVGAVPDAPWRAAFFLIHLALLLMATRERGPIVAMASLALAALLGRWALLQWLLVASVELTTSLLRSRRDRQNFLLSLRSGLPSSLLFTAALLLGAGLFLRPILSLLFSIAAIHFALCSGRTFQGSGRTFQDSGRTFQCSVGLVTGPMAGRTSETPATQSVAGLNMAHVILASMLIFATVSLFPWSGILTAGFPLPVPPAILLVTAILALSAALLPWRIAVVTGTGILVSIWLIHPPSRAAFPSPVGVTLAPGHSFNLLAEGESRIMHLVFSGTNLSGESRQKLVARVEVLDREARGYGRPLKMGDLADWGAFRRKSVFYTRNSFPHSFFGSIEGYGREAFLRGAGQMRLELPTPISLVRVTADAALPPEARLLIESVEYESP